MTSESCVLKTAKNIDKTPQKMPIGFSRPEQPLKTWRRPYQTWTDFWGRFRGRLITWYKRCDKTDPNCVIRIIMPAPFLPAFVPEILLYFSVLCWTASNGLSIVPDILTYKTCYNAPPGFSPGCMDNVTVYPGGKATFNCQVSTLYDFAKVWKSFIRHWPMVSGRL